MINTAVFSSSVSQLQAFKVSANGSWYAAEFEVAYDQSTSLKPYGDFRLEWQIQPNSISNITLNGTQTGQMNGTLQATSGGPNFFSQITNGIIDGALKIGSDTLKSKNISFLPNLIKSNLVAATSSALGGIAKGFLSGILGGTSSTSTQRVSLKINTNINITGTATVESQVFDNIFSIPGSQDVTNTQPFYPQYEYPLGVFYISNKPTVIRTTNVTLQSPYYYIQQNYQVDENSFSLIFNPRVIALANITNIQKEVVILDYDPYEEYEMSGNMEQVADRTIYTGLNAFSYTKQSPRPRIQANKLAIRITFDVVPKDGSPKCTIVKTFLANQG